jgi:ferritin-like metal-binding protein YciE
MKLFTSLEFNSLEDLFIEQIEDLYDAENRLTKALPKMAEAAHSPDLRSAFQTHLRETEGHVVRLERVFQKLGRTPERETCEAMKGLIAEGEEMISAKGDPSVKDAALIAAAQRVEHYEIAAYGTARTFARQLGRESIANELQETLDEEGNADKILTEIAESVINIKAHHA